MKWKKQSNIFIVIFNLYKTNFSDIIRALLSDLLRLNCERIKVTINKDSVQVITFYLTFLNNILQQNSNIDIKNLTIEYFYQSCIINNKKKYNLSYNIICNNYYYYKL